MKGANTVFKSAAYVLKENFTNLYRIYSISRYELLADIRDSKLGLFWNFANPVIQVLTYWLVFGVIMPGRSEQDGIPYICWLLGGIVVWFFISPCITNGCNAIYSKRDIITKMKFPVSILPATVVIKELFNHVCLLLIVVASFAAFDFYPNLYWLGLIYYLFCAVVFSIALSLTTSVLNMLARDTRKLILACMRLLMYLTPILWSPDKLNAHPTLKFVMNFNPIHYIVQGYRDCFFFHEGIASFVTQTAIFWGITLFLFMIGSYMIYKFKHKFMDLL